MADQNGGHLAHRPRFFKFLYPTPSLKLRIPLEFHTHLPSGFPKTANLLCPHTKVWDVEVHQDGSDIFFQRGWPEFVKAHDLCTGYLLLFQYNGHMNFEVKVFDTTSCLKDYSLKDCTPVVPHYTEIEDSSGSEDLIHSNKSDDETQSLPSSLGAQHSVHVSSTCKRPAYIEIEDSSESEDQSTNEASDEIPDNYLSKRRKFSNSSCREQEVQKNVKGKKTLRTTPNSNCCDKFETMISRPMVESYQIMPPENSSVRRKEKLSFQRASSLAIASKKEKIIWTRNDTKNNLRCERIIKGYNLSSGYVRLPRAFCVKNDLVANRPIFLKRKLEEEREVLPCKWPVQLYFNHSHCRIQKGWTRFCKENSLKIGDKCIFQFISKDTFLVEMIPTKHMPLACSSVMRKEKLSYRRASAPSSPATASNKKKNSWKKDPMSNLQCELIIKEYNLTSHFIWLPRKFCEPNGLVRKKYIFFKRNIQGKSWPVKFTPRNCGGQLTTGWNDFARENGLKEGDQCNLQLIFEDTFHVDVVKKEMLSKKNWRASVQNTSGEREKEKFQVTVRRYHLLNNYMSIPRGFCQRNELTTRREIVLKDSEGKEWHVKFSLNRSNAKGGRFIGVAWRKFTSENGLRVGDKCFFELVAEETMLVQVVKA